MIPTQEQLMKFIRSKNFINFSIIAKHFNIKNTTVSDLVKDLEEKKLVDIIDAGGSKMVQVRENKMKKRGQVSVYIILGLVVLITTVLLFSFRNYIFKSQFERELESIEILEEFKPVKNYLDSCVSQVALEGAQILGSQGGYIELPQENVPVNPNAPFSNKLDVFRNNGLEVPYWFYETGNGIQKQQIPTLSEMQDQLAVYINSNLNDCLNNFTAFQGYDFSSFNNIETEIEIRDEEIFVRILSDMEISKDGLTAKFDKFLITVPVPLGKLYDTSLNLFEESSRNNFFEEKTIDMMVLYDEIPLSKTEFSCDIKIWDENQVKTDFKRIVNRNIGAVKTSQTTDYFTLGSVDKDINSNFLYSENWPFYMEVFPSDNGILKGDEIIKKTGALKALSIFLCLNNYHFVYDVKYPILITLNKNNYNFQFAQMIVIDNNQPKENILGTLNPIETVNICDRKATKTRVNTLTVNNNDVVVPLDNVLISFKCLTNTCNIGETSNENGNAVLEENFQQCLNGQIIAEKEGYNKATSTISTNQESQVSLVLEPYYNKEIEIVVVDKSSGATRELRSNEKVLLTFDHLTEDYSEAITYPETKNINLISGDYAITTYLSMNDPGKITIDPETVEKCVKVPKGGLLGLFFDETKCITTTLEGFNLEDVVVGGAVFEYGIDRINLANSDKIIIYTIFDMVPENNDEITLVYEGVSLNADNINFKYPELK
ncbi:hypothetical protein J4213_02885 [Candidatus Woesearchaeota archaeon]|nr:hypothetical protein [Candidatus Woesearchaeota archaeon]